MRDGMVRIGALARHVEVMNSPIVAQHLPLIAEAMPHVAHVAVRNRGTFGGSVALADPAAEMPACVLALRASLVVDSVRGRRTIAADDYFTGLYETARGRGRDAGRGADSAAARRDHVSVFMELARRHGDFAMAGLACCARIKGDTIEDARLAYFGSEERPVLAAPGDGGGERQAVVGCDARGRRAPRSPRISIRWRIPSAAAPPSCICSGC